MAGPGRNNPCPCGSGKKYKKCCLEKRELEAGTNVVPEFERVGPAEKALQWIYETFPGEVARVIVEQYSGGLTEEELEDLRSLPEEVRSMFFLNAHEWVLAEGRDEADRRFLDVALGQMGPALSPSDRLFLLALGASHLDLHEVVEVRPGEGLTLISKTDAKAGPVWVLERSGSRDLNKGDYLGARVLPLEPPVLSGAVYFFSPDRYLRLRSELFGKRRRTKLDPERISRSIIRQWLSVLVAPPPRITDASTGEPLVLTTVHYRIRDFEALRRALASAPDVEEEEEGWVRFEDPSASPRRPWCTLNRKGGDRLELFAHTIARADEAERWLSGIAGGSIQKITRELTDPRNLWKERFRERPEPSPNEVMESLSRAERTELCQSLYRQMYAKWADEPIPYLNGKTPRQAIRSKAGRTEVVELLRTYEKGEREQAEAQDRDLVDLAFLWKELGLERS